MLSKADLEICVSRLTLGLPLITVCLQPNWALILLKQVLTCESKNLLEI